MRVLGGILLVAGTTIGAGMLALPVATGVAGFFPSLALLLVCWAFMTFAALLFLEVSLACGTGTNLITMARKTLGPIGEGVAWLSYLMLLYALTAAYIAGCGPLLLQGFCSLLGVALPEWVAPLPFVVIFGSFVYLGTKPVDWINRLLMLGLVLCYVVLVVVIGPHVRADLLLQGKLAGVATAFPVVFTTFGFAIIVPSLVTYLKGNVKQLRMVVIVGSLIPLIVFVLWELLIMGVIPLEGLRAMLDQGQPTRDLALTLDALLHKGWIGLLAAFFSFFAIVTSFLGVSLSLSDFLADGLRIKRTQVGRLLTSLLTFIPPLIFVWLYPRGFILALEYAGVFVAILLGILPAAMAWASRKRHAAVSYRLVGGRMSLIAVMVFFAAVIVFESVRHFQS